MHIKTKSYIRLLGIFIFIIILLKMDVHKFFEMFTKLNIFLLAGASVLITFLIIIKAIRWQLLMKAQNIDYSLKDSILMYAASVYMGTITPGKIGEFVKVLYLRKDKHPFGKSFATVILDRLFDLISLVVLTYFGILLFYTIFKNAVTIVSIGFLGLFFLAVVSIHKKKYIIGILEYCISNLFPNKNRSSAISDFYNGLISLNIIQFASAMLITLLGWAVYITAMYMLALSINIEITLLYLATCVAISTVITLIPISISGIGTRDATLVILFSFEGLSSESAIAFSTLILFLYAVNGFVGLLAWMKKPLYI